MGETGHLVVQEPWELTVNRSSLPAEECPFRTVDVLDRTEDPRRIPDHDSSSRYVLCNDGTSADERIFPDYHPGKKCDVHSNPCAPFDRWALEMGTTEGMRIIGSFGARREKDVIFDGCELRHVNIAMDLHSVADHAPVIDGRVIPDIEAVADLIFFPDYHVMPRLQVAADRRSGIDHAKGANDRVRTDANGRELDWPSRLLTDDRKSIDCEWRLQDNQLVVDRDHIIPRGAGQLGFV